MADSNKKFQVTAAFQKIFLKCIPQPGIALSRHPIALDPAQWVKASISSDFRKALSAGNWQPVEGEGSFLIPQGVDETGETCSIISPSNCAMVGSGAWFRPG
jgi:hypothetical protein